jgi:hypothetical protein
MERLNTSYVDMGGKKNKDCSCPVVGCEISSVELSGELGYEGTATSCMKSLKA